MGRHDAELDRIREAYSRRHDSGLRSRYTFFEPAHLRLQQELERALIRCFRSAGLRDLSRVKLLEVGCGGGTHLLNLIRLGFDPANLTGNELLPDRVEEARKILPGSVRLVAGDAAAMDEDEAFDVVFQATVFSSILDEGLQRDLAATMWRMLRPGGGILWYDFAVSNPRNPDVRGVPRRRIASLFPGGTLRARSIVLAPPLARLVCRIHPGLYAPLASVPALRTHLLGWVRKPGQEEARA